MALLVAQFGQLHPDIAAARKLRQNVFVAEMYLDRLYAQGMRVVRYQPLPRYPAVERDFSFVFDDGVTFEKIEQVVVGLGLSELRSFVPVEIFRGGNVPAGKYSLLLRARFQSAERTLREDEVAQWSAQIIKATGGVWAGSCERRPFRPPRKLVILSGSLTFRLRNARRSRRTLPSSLLSRRHRFDAQQQKCAAYREPLDFARGRLLRLRGCFALRSGHFAQDDNLPCTLSVCGFASLCY